MASMLEQTTVNQYFKARKSSSSQASKRRKIDPQTLSINPTKKLSTTVTQGERKVRRKRTVKQTEKSLSVSELLNASPLVFNSVTTESKDDHIASNLKRKTTGDCPEKVPEPPLTPTKFDNTDINDHLNDYPVNPTINEQAKLVLYSRGAAVLKAASLKKSQTAKSPMKASEVLEGLSPKKVEANMQSSQADRRSRLKNKFAHLLKGPDINSDNHNKQRLSVNSSEDKQESTEPKRQSRQRACDKYKHLAQKTTPTSFVLPEHYKVLLEMFRCVDSVLFLLHQRSETCTFEKLKKSVQKMCGRDFEHKHLAMMKSIYPTGFTFRQEKGLRTSEGKSSKNFDYQLTVEANFKEVMLRPSMKIPASVLITRRLKFENNLLMVVKEFHQKYLQKLNIKLDDNEIHRWHPHFKVNEIPHVEQSNLPKPPITKTFSSAADVLLDHRGHLSTKVKQALVNASEKSTSSTTTRLSSPVKIPPSALNTTPKLSSPLKVKPTAENDSSTISKLKSKNTKLKGVSQSLLERIREKEQTKLQLEMTRDPIVEERIAQMERLPEMSRILKMYFTSEKKVAIPIESCAIKLSESYGVSLPTNKVEMHIRLLAELVPAWITIVMVRKCPYVKLTKNADINKIILILNKAKSKEEEK